MRYAYVCLGMCEFEYVSVHESGLCGEGVHVIVNMYICICVPNVIINKFAIVVIHYVP